MPRIRTIQIIAFICSFLFYYFMTTIEPEGHDYFLGRCLVALVCLIGFLLTFTKYRYIWVSFSINSAMISYMALYAYLLRLNDWSVFHRWAYFVVVSIVITAAAKWRDYIFMFFAGMIFPAIFYQSTSMTVLEYLHFYAALLVAYIVIGITMRSNFLYREEVIKLTRTLVESSKMTALGQLSASISHEIKNPLTILTLAGHQLEKHLEENKTKDTKTLKTVSRISEAIHRIENVVNGLRQFSGVDEVKQRELIDLQRIFEEVLSLYHERFKANNIIFKSVYSSDQILFYGSKSELGQIFLNLLNNAYEGSLRNHTGHEVKVTFVSSDRDIRILFEDNGPGVPIEIEGDIFNPLFTTKNSGTGLGLGLSTSLQIAKSYNGDLYIDRSISQSCFTFWIPK